MRFVENGGMRRRWSVWFLSEWDAIRLGEVSAIGGLEALDVARERLARAWARARRAAPGGALCALRVGVPPPRARCAGRADLFSPRVRLDSLYPTGHKARSEV